MNLRAAFLAAAAIAFCLPDGARADRIEFKDNRPVLQGVIVHETDELITIDDGSLRLNVPRDIIRRIIPGTEAEHRMLSARQHLQDGRFDQALPVIAEASRQDVDADSIASLLLVHSNALVEAIPRLETERRRELNEILTHIRGARLPIQPDFLAALLHWHLELGNIEAARSVLQELSQNYPNALETDRRRIADWFDAKIEAALQSGDYTRALDLLIQLRSLDPGRAGDRRIEMILLMAREKRDAGEFARTLEIYRDQLLPISPLIARDRITVTLQQAESQYRADEQLGRAIDLYEKYGLPTVEDFARERLLRLWIDLGQKFLETEDADQAHKAFARAEMIDPGSTDRYMLQLEHLERQQAIGPEDHLGYYRLGEWSLENDLLDEAMEAFKVAEMHPSLAPAASEQIRRIRNESIERDMKNLLDLYEKGRYLDVLQGVSQLKERNLPKGLARQTEELEKLTREAIRLTQHSRPQTAEVLWQQAERAYFTGSRPKAVELIRAIIEKYPDTPAAERALKFYELIRPRLNLDRLEVRRGRKLELPSYSENVEDSPIAREIRRLRNPGAAGEDRP